MELLLDRLRGAKPVQTMVFTPELIVRQSTAPHEGNASAYRRRACRRNARRRRVPLCFSGTKQKAGVSLVLTSLHIAKTRRESVALSARDPQSSSSGGQWSGDHFEILLTGKDDAGSSRAGWGTQHQGPARGMVYGRRSERADPGGGARAEVTAQSIGWTKFRLPWCPSDHRPATTIAVIARVPKITEPSTSSPRTQCAAKIARNGKSNCT